MLQSAAGVALAVLHVAHALLTKLRRLSLAVHPLPLASAILIALLFGCVGQLYELYTGLIEIAAAPFFRGGGEPDWNKLQIVFAILSMVTLSVILYSANAYLGRYRSADAFGGRHGAVIDPELVVPVHYVGLLAAVLPWIGLVQGMSVAINRGLTHIERALHLPLDTRALPNVHNDAQSYFDPASSSPFFVRLSSSLEEEHRSLMAWHRLLPLSNSGSPDHAFWWSAVATLAAVCLILLLIVTISPRRTVDWLLRVRPYHGLGALGVASGGTAVFRFRHSLSDWVRRCEIALLPRASERLSFLFRAIAGTVAGATLIVPALFVILKPDEAPNDGLAVSQPNPGWIAGWLSQVPRGFWTGLDARVSVFHNPIGFWILAIVLLAVLMMALPHGSERTPSAHPRLRLLGLAISALAMLFVVVTGFYEFKWAEIARVLGPLAVMINACIVIVCILVAFMLAAQQTGFPTPLIFVAVTVVVVLKKLFGPQMMWALPLLLIAGYAFRRSTAALAIVAAMAVISIVDPHDLTAAGEGSIGPIEGQFKDWLDKRHVQVSRASVTGAPSPGADAAAPGVQKPSYPVFVIAAEGGGIYAASNIAAFLARMQAECPNFAEHVFAISGVSGGSIGAMVFHSALDMIDPVPSDTHCPLSSRPRTSAESPSTIETKIEGIVTDDHLSPLVGLIVPDLLGTSRDRAWGLRSSLLQSLESHLCDKNDQAKCDAASDVWKLPGSYATHWQKNLRAPALVFNTTWTDVGKRVAYAPFSFETISGRREFIPLETFGQPAAPLDKSSFGQPVSPWAWNNRHFTASLIDAAVDSARFPGIISALEIEQLQDVKSSQTAKHWYFVDGGYVDASGSFTAEDIYQRLKNVADAANASPSGPSFNLDVRLILVRSSQNTDAEKGRVQRDLKDVVAPVRALFTVRSLLSRFASDDVISRVVASGYSLLDASKDQKAADARLRSNTEAAKLESLEAVSQLPAVVQTGQDDWKVTVVELDQEDLNLELGWKISRLTYEMISLQLGHPDLCQARSAIAAPALDRREAFDPQAQVPTEQMEMTRRLNLARAIRANSCVMASLRRLLGNPAPADKL